MILIIFSISISIPNNLCLLPLKQGKRRGRCFPRRIVILSKMSKDSPKPSPISSQLPSLANLKDSPKRLIRPFLNLTFPFKPYQNSSKLEEKWSPIQQNKEYKPNFWVRSVTIATNRWNSSLSVVSSQARWCGVVRQTKSYREWNGQ